MLKLDRGPLLVLCRQQDQETFPSEQSLCSSLKYRDSYKLQDTIRATFLIVLSTKDSTVIADVRFELYIAVILKPIKKVAALKRVLHLYVSVHPGYGRTLLAAGQCV